MDQLETVVTAIAVLLVPIGLGALIGWGLRRVRGRRFAGLAAALGLIGAPIVLLTALTLQIPLIGVWDALLEGALVGAGVLWTAHRTLASRSGVAVALGSLAVSLLLLELACRAFLPPPPAFPTQGGPHFWLADAMRASTQSVAWDLRSKEIVCSTIYDDGYPGMLDVKDVPDVVVPRRFTPRAGAARSVLHVGDSMTFGFGVRRDETFTADLGRLEPATQHINGAVPGIAPDAYLALIRKWVALHRIDLVVMYVFEGNDLAGLDDRYPCCEWQSLLTYGADGPQLRCPSAPRVDFGKAGTTWLRYNSPPPYLVRALVGYSAAAAHVGAAIVNQMPGMPLMVNSTEALELEHLEAIVRAASDELRARGIAFVVAVLPARNWVENPTSAHVAPEIVARVQRLGVPVLDLSPAVVEAAATRRDLFNSPPDPHFSAAGNDVIARWLHDRLAAAAGLPPAP